MVIRISEFGKLLLVESGIQEFFPWNPESWALGFNDRILNLLPGIRNPQRAGKEKNFELHLSNGQVKFWFYLSKAQV